MPLHKFVLKEGAEELVPPDVRQRIDEKEKRVMKEFTGKGVWYEDEIEGELASLIQHEYFTTIESRAHLATIRGIIMNRREYGWIIGSTEEKEDLLENDPLVLSGIAASRVLSPEKFWEIPQGFSGPSDYHGTIGVMLLKNDHIFDKRQGNPWKSTENNEKYTTMVYAPRDLDIDVVRVRVSHQSTKDPFAKEVNYKPIARPDRKMITSSAGEANLLAGALKYLQQKGLNAPPAEEVTINPPPTGNGVDTTSVSGLKTLFQFPLQTGTTVKNGACMEMRWGDTSRTYAIHIDDNERFAISGWNNSMPSKKSALALPAAEVPLLITGIFDVARRQKGRINFETLSAIYRALTVTN